MNQPTPVTEQSPELQPASSSLPAKMFNVLATPGEVFEEVRGARESAANWVVPTVLLMVIGWICAFIVFSQDSIQAQLRDTTARAIEKQLAKSHVSGAQADQAREMGERWGVMGAQISAYVAPVVTAWGGVFWWALIIWLVGAQALKGGFSFMKAVEVAGLASMINVLDTVLRTLLILVTGNLFASPSLALLVKDFDPQNPAHTLLALVNVMLFWVLAVRSVGVARMSRTSFIKAAAWVFGIWAGYTGLLTGIGFGIRAIFAR